MAKADGGSKAGPWKQSMLTQGAHNPAAEFGNAAGIPAGGTVLRADPKPGPINADIGIGLPGNPARPFTNLRDS